MFALEPGLLGTNLRALGQSLRDIAAVLVVSPHWQTADLRVGSSVAPETLHDFAGFPAPLYELQYPGPGAPALAQDAAHSLAQAGFEVGLDERRGLDHGAWCRCAIYSRMPTSRCSGCRCRAISTRPGHCAWAARWRRCASAGC